MDDSDLIEHRRLVVVGAGHEIDFLSKMRQASMDQSADAAKWLLASLLAINGGGAVAAVNSIEKLQIGVPAGLFAAGIMLALASAVIIQSVGYRSLAPIQEAIGYWITVVDDGTQADEYEAKLKKRFLKLRWFGMLAPAAGWCSAGCFVCGALTLNNAPSRVDQHNVTRCQAIQDDMISSHPKRADDAEIFVALGCKPRGAGGFHVASS